MRSKRPTLIICLCFLFLFESKGQEDWNSQWTVFSPDYVKVGTTLSSPGLLSDSINAAAWDKKGNYYFALGGTIQVYHQKAFKTLDRQKYGNPDSVNALFVDNKERLWIGTAKGLFLKQEENDFSKVLIPGMDVITEITADDKNKIYITGYSKNSNNIIHGGISILQGEKWSHFSTKDIGIENMALKNITFDKNGNLWACVEGSALGLVSFNGTKWTLYDKENSGLISNEINGIAFDSHNKSWFVMPSVVASFDGINWNYFPLEELYLRGLINRKPPNEMPLKALSIAVDENDVVYVGTDNGGIISIQSQLKTTFHTENSLLISNKIKRILVDDMNRKWFISGIQREEKFETEDYSSSENESKKTGVVIYQDPLQNTLSGWMTVTTPPKTSLGNTFYEVNKDEMGNLWFASSSLGVVKYTDSGWFSFQHPYPDLVGELINSIAVYQNEVYAGAQLKGLYKIVENELLKVSQEQIPYKNKSIVDIEFDDEGNLWIAHITGVDVYKNDTLISYNKEFGLLSNTVFKLFLDQKGRMWICTTKGISVYDKGRWTFHSKKSNNLPGYVFDVTEDPNGNIWAGTSKGLFKLEGDNWTKKEPLGENIPKWFRITCMTTDFEGKIWIGTEENGVISIDTNDKWRHYNQNNSGIDFNKIWDMEISKEGDLWICTEKETNSRYQNSNSDKGGNSKLNFSPTATIVIFKGIGKD